MKAHSHSQRRLGTDRQQSTGLTGRTSGLALTQQYKKKPTVQLWFLLFLLVLVPLAVRAQQDKVAALKQSLGENQKRLQQYQWIETTVISVKGDEKSRIQKACQYGPDGKVQKQQISAPPQQSSPGGLKGRIIAKKKGEMTDYMQNAVALVHQYIPPDSQRIQAAKDSGNISFKPVGSGIQLVIQNYLKPGDTLAISLQGAGIQQIHVGTYLDSQKDAISLDANFASLNDGTSYPAQIVLAAPAKNIQVVIQNSDYQRMAAMLAPSQAGQPAAPAQSIDTLTAPIALYPDALVAQILTSSTNSFEVSRFAGWLSQNSNLLGSALQDAAQQAGFDTSFVALAPFPQVVQMMAQQSDWTKQLGEAVTTNRGAVLESIQRLRAQAQAAGNLKSTQQQEVTTQTTSSGTQVIVIQPTNPQIVYVPQYNPQTVYVESSSSSSSATAAAVGFTAGVIIGAAARNNYYYGPYSWRADNRQDYWDNRQDYAQQRSDTYQQNASQRQSTAQANQSQRQSTAQANQSQRQSAAQTNQTQRQSSAATAQGNAQANQAQRQSAAGTYSRGSGEAASQRSGMSSGGFSGFQGAGQTRSESARGQGSLGGGGFGGGGGRFGGGGGGGGRRRR